MTEQDAHRLRDAVQAHADALATRLFGQGHGVFTEIGVERSEEVSSGWALTITNWSQIRPQRLSEGHPLLVTSTMGADPLSWIEEDGYLDLGHLDATLTDGLLRASEPASSRPMRSRQ